MRSVSIVSWSSTSTIRSSPGTTTHSSRTAGTRPADLPPSQGPDVPDPSNRGPAELLAAGPRRVSRVCLPDRASLRRPGDLPRGRPADTAQVVARVAHRQLVAAGGPVGRGD